MEASGWLLPLVTSTIFAFVKGIEADLLVVNQGFEKVGWIALWVGS